MKKFIVLLMALCLLVPAINASAAINADPEFISASITLTSGKLVVYSANVYDEKEYICVVSAALYRKTSTNDWEFMGSLPVPSYVAYNSAAYGAYVDCSAYIRSGTYRITATYDADGYQITRNSNERTF